MEGGWFKSSTDHSMEGEAWPLGPPDLPRPSGLEVLLVLLLASWFTNFMVLLNTSHSVNQQ